VPAPASRAGHYFRTFLRDDLEQIVAARQAGGLKSPDEAAWLLASEAEQEFGLSSSTLKRWARQGCKLIGNSRLHSRKRMVLQNGRPFWVRVYQRAHLERIANVRDAALAAGHDDKWITYGQVKEQFGNIDPNYLYGWHLRGCPLLKGQKLGRRQTTRPISSARHHGPRIGKVWQFNLSQVEEIASKLAEIDKSKYEDESGVWLTAPAAREKYGFISQHLERWRVEPSRLLGRRCIQAQQVPKVTLKASGGSRRWVYLDPSFA
jgi:hypothetical protein